MHAHNAFIRFLVTLGLINASFAEQRTSLTRWRRQSEFFARLAYHKLCGLKWLLAAWTCGCRRPMMLTPSALRPSSLTGSDRTSRKHRRSEGHQWNSTFSQNGEICCIPKWLEQGSQVCAGFVRRFLQVHVSWLVLPIPGSSQRQAWMRVDLTLHLHWKGWRSSLHRLYTSGKTSHSRRSVALKKTRSTYSL